VDYELSNELPVAMFPLWNRFFWLAPCRTKWDNGRARGKQNSATVDRTSVTSCHQQEKHCWRVRKSHRGYLRCSRNCLAWGDTALPKTPSYRGKGNPTSRSHPTLDAHLNIAAKVWNALPPAITSLSSLGAFKRALKTEPFRRSYGNANYRPQQHWRYSCSVFMNDLRRDEIRGWWWWWWLIWALQSDLGRLFLSDQLAITAES